MSFVHLHTHSHYSLLEASCQIVPLVERVAALGMPAVALTDHGNMFGAVEFYFAAKNAGVRPILGFEAYIAPKGRLEKSDGERNRRLVLLAQNFKGYQTLCRLSTRGYKEGFYYKPRIDYEVLREESNDILVLSGGIRGEVADSFLREGPDRALEKIRALSQLFPERFYLELNRTNVSEWDELNPFLIEASRITGVPFIAANDVHYLDKKDQLVQEVLVCIGTNKTLHDETRWRLGSDQFYLKGPQEMASLFSEWPEACTRTLEVAERCNVEFRFKDEQGKVIYHLPSFPVEEHKTIDQVIREMALKGLEERFRELELRGEAPRIEDRGIYLDRLEFELGVIDRMGFNGYFLIVQDFINWAKSQGIPVGPGRGSGAASLVAYSLKITDLDPIAHKLIFERFLNPERVSMPDFDIDFCQDRRGEVINYVTEKYGKESVSQIITYGKLQARAAVRDVGRVLGMTYSEVDVIAKLIPEKLGITLKEALEMEPRFQELMDDDPQIARLMELAQGIEGMVRHAGIHAAGVIIADGRLVDHAPLYRGIEGENVIQYDMKHAEKMGLIKFDFLGLKTLTFIQNGLDLVHRNRGVFLTTADIPLSDPKIYELIARGDTSGIFQFESEGITETIKKIQPTCFSDITAINALYRPGPMEMIPEYTARKHGTKSVEYLFAELEEILSETYGIVVYQEQVQMIAAKIANYSLGEADILRKAMGKKIPEEMAKQRERFLQGAQEQGFDRDRAAELFSLMEEFAKYGFNKAHAAAYCVLAAQTAWLKHYYPVEFFAALLSTEMQDTDKVVKYIKDATHHGIEVLPPHLNRSAFKFSVEGSKIFFGLGAVKGVGGAAVDAILEARSKFEGGFPDLITFFEEVDLRRVNKKVIECLIKSGALDGFGFHRAQLMNGYALFLDEAEKKQHDRERGQFTLFSLIEETEPVQLKECSPWGKMAYLAYEKEVLGFYLSDHPLRGLEFIGDVLGASTLVSLTQSDEPRNGVKVVGIIAQFREILTKKGTRMAFATLEDLTGSMELVIFPDLYALVEGEIRSESPLVVEGKVEKGEGPRKMIVESVKMVDKSLGNVKRIALTIDAKNQSWLPIIKEIFSRHPGPTKLWIKLSLPELTQAVSLEVKEPSGIRLGRELFDDLGQQFEEPPLFDRG